MPNKTIIFDFDGTIANTLDILVNIYNGVAPEFRCRTVKQEDRIKLRAKRPQEFLKDYGVTNLKLPFLLFRMRKALHKEINNIKPIEGIVPVLKNIKKAGFNMGIMTSNSKENVTIFLELHGLSDVFDFVYSGRNVFGKNKVLSKLLMSQKLEKGNTAYVGDETRDIEASRKAGIPMVAVSWGFNTREILLAQQPNHIVDEPEKLLDCLIRL